MIRGNLDSFRSGRAQPVNTPALDPAPIYDMRNPHLQAQAEGGDRSSCTANRPAHGTTARRDCRVPADGQPVLFEQGAAGLCRRGAGAAASGRKEAGEKRGREFFVDAPWDPPNKKGACALCHSGPLLNTANEFTTVPTGAPPGWRAFDILVSSRNLMNNPVRRFAVTDSCNTTVMVRFTRSRNHDHRRVQYPHAGVLSAARGGLHSAPGVLRQHVQDTATPRRQPHGAGTFMTTQRRVLKTSWNSTCSSLPPISVFRLPIRTSC